MGKLSKAAESVAMAVKLHLPEVTVLDKRTSLLEIRPAGLVQPLKDRTRYYYVVLLVLRTSTNNNYSSASIQNRLRSTY